MRKPDTKLIKHNDTIFKVLTWGAAAGRERGGLQVAHFVRLLKDASFIYLFRYYM
jgi:hypothetical protein